MFSKKSTTMCNYLRWEVQITSIVNMTKYVIYVVAELSKVLSLISVVAVYSYIRLYY